MLLTKKRILLEKSGTLDTPLANKRKSPYWIGKIENRSTTQFEALKPLAHNVSSQIHKEIENHCHPKNKVDHEEWNSLSF